MKEIFANTPKVLRKGWKRIRFDFSRNAFESFMKKVKIYSEKMLGVLGQKLQQT